MLGIRSIVAGHSLIAAAKTMNAAGSSESPGLCLSGSPGSRPGSTGSRPGSPGSRPGSPPRPLRLAAVPGYEPDRVNDMLLLNPSAGHPRCGLDAEEDGRAHVVFFPGDIQNFHQEMVLQPDAAQWTRWSLERVAQILARRFPSAHVWVVRPARLYLHKFSCFDNFVTSNMFGAPEHSADHGALRHLLSLLSHGLDRARLPNPIEALVGVGRRAPAFSLSLVGFSKGCVVLNQMVYELEAARADPELAAFVERVTDMYWLDGGHPGGSETWVTDRRALGELAACGAAVHAHVTPYEVRDPMRAWVGREHRRFVRTLEELGVHVEQRVHFEDEPASLENHFRVIEEF